MDASPMVVRHPSPVIYRPLSLRLSSCYSQIHDGLLPRPRSVPPIFCIRQGRRPPPLQVTLSSEHVYGYAYQHGLVRLWARTPDWIAGFVGSGGDQRRVYDFSDGNICRVYDAHRVEVCV